MDIPALDELIANWGHINKPGVSVTELTEQERRELDRWFYLANIEYILIDNKLAALAGALSAFDAEHVELVLDVTKDQVSPPRHDVSYYQPVAGDGRFLNGQAFDVIWARTYEPEGGIGEARPSRGTCHPSR
jgi:hypothetical protein